MEDWSPNVCQGRGLELSEEAYTVSLDSAQVYDWLLIYIFFFCLYSAYLNKSETRKTASVLKYERFKTAYEINIAQPKTDKSLSSPAQFPSFFTV